MVTKGGDTPAVNGAQGERQWAAVSASSGEKVRGLLEIEPERCDGDRFRFNSVMS